ncbi:hypothetical protein DB30_01135 [Enhygromyxa salina]|uniref:Uncharacterized protein n=1 Tax=Enhygromyxa salina TaxID=215803 RepID=A0A0C2CXV0_9BACT|nr:hypothetical protein [Enhygromyxa salina]KIG12647.1 hypothetical protein DB30_01135 [Enhygromyxa salina]
MQRPLVTSACLIFALACTPAEPGTGESSDTSSSDTTAGGTDTTDGTDTFSTSGDGDGDTGAEVLATIDGMVADMESNPLPTPGLQFCGPVDEGGAVKLCIPVPVDETGAFNIGVTELGVWNLKVVHGNVDGRYFAGQAFQLTINEDDSFDFTSPPIVVPEITEVTDLSAAMGETAVTIDAVLRVTLDPELSQSPDFTPPSELGGIEVPAEFWRVTEVDGSPVIAAWAFNPFGVHALEGEFGFEIAGGLGLAPGDPVTIHYIEKVNGVIHEAGTGIVNAQADGIDITITDGLHELSWLLVTG